MRAVVEVPKDGGRPLLISAHIILKQNGRGRLMPAAADVPPLAPLAPDTRLWSRSWVGCIFLESNGTPPA